MGGARSHVHPGGLLRGCDRSDLPRSGLPGGEPVRAEVSPREHLRDPEGRGAHELQVLAAGVRAVQAVESPRLPRSQGAGPGARERVRRRGRGSRRGLGIRAGSQQEGGGATGRPGRTGEAAGTAERPRARSQRADAEAARGGGAPDREGSRRPRDRGFPREDPRGAQGADRKAGAVGPGGPRAAEIGPPKGRAQARSRRESGSREPEKSSWPSPPPREGGARGRCARGRGRADRGSGRGNGKEAARPTSVGEPGAEGPRIPRPRARRTWRSGPAEPAAETEAPAPRHGRSRRRTRPAEARTPRAEAEEVDRVEVKGTEVERKPEADVKAPEPEPAVEREESAAPDAEPQAERPARSSRSGRGRRPVREKKPSAESETESASAESKEKAERAASPPETAEPVSSETVEKVAERPPSDEVEGPERSDASDTFARRKRRVVRGFRKR